jgi:hypothetical protein
MRLGVFEHVEAGHIRQRQIQQQHVDRVLPELIHRFPA